MGDFIFYLLLVICGILLCWLAYYLFFGPLSPLYPFMPWSKKKKFKGQPGDPQVCPVCSMLMFKGDLVKTIAFPSSEGSSDRLMYIKGCFSCTDKGKKIPRKCPVCGAKMGVDDFLVARMFERKFEKNHVHVLGCNQCRKVD